MQNMGWHACPHTQIPMVMWYHQQTERPEVLHPATPQTFINNTRVFLSNAHVLLMAVSACRAAIPALLIDSNSATDYVAVHAVPCHHCRPKLQSMMDGYGKRALQALLGLGYLLTVMHERTLGGTIKFSAATIISPNTSDGNHIKPRNSSSGLNMLASLRQFMRDCPSLSPLSPSSSVSRRTAAAAAAAVAGAELAASGSGGRLLTADSSGSTPRRPHLAGSFEAAWDRVLHPPLASSGNGGSRGGARGAIPACQGLQVCYTWPEHAGCVDSSPNSSTLETSPTCCRSETMRAS